MKKPLKFIITADDFGISRAVNSAIAEAYHHGYLTHASIIANSICFEEAVSLHKSCANLAIGVHINLTTGKPLSKSSKLVDSYGYFKYGFIGLLLASVFYKEKLLPQIEEEIETQINKLKNNNIKISHLDSHRHIHIIPSIYKIVTKLAFKHNIPRVRVINESLLETIRITGNLRFLIDGGLIKYCILKTLSMFNKPKDSSIYFFSILNSCKIKPSLIRKIQYLSGKYEAVEIMLHPSHKCTNESVDTLQVKASDLQHLKSRFRQYELNTAYKLKEVISEKTEL